jgi:hypothetical protein
MSAPPIAPNQVPPTSAPMSNQTTAPVETPRNQFAKSRNKFDVFAGALKYYSPKLYGAMDKKDMRDLFAIVRSSKKAFDADYETFATQNVKLDNKETTYKIFAEQVLKAKGYKGTLENAAAAMRSSYSERHPGKELPPLSEADFLSDANAPASSGAQGSFEQSVREKTGIANERVQPGQVIPGLGTVGAGGQLSRGITQNIGGGNLATVVSSNDAGDYVSQGPQSVEVAKQTLRPKLVVAGGEDVRPSIQEDGQSNAIFESFSIVPDGYGLGPENRLHLLNKQNDVMRFGAEKLYEPRVDAPITPARPIPAQWKESMSLKELEEAYATKIGMELLKARGVSLVERNPIGVLEDDMNMIPSSKGLPRQERGPSPFMPTVFNLEDFLPARDPPGMQMNSLLGSDTQRGTLGYRRKRVFESLMK